MISKERLGLAGRLTLTLKDETGRIKDQREVKNLVVGTGLGFITSRMVGVSSAVMSHMALGSGTTTQASGDTDLESILGSRIALDGTARSGTNNETVTYTATFGPGVATGAVTEAGVFNALSSGTMLCRTTFPVVNKQAGDTLLIAWAITLAAT